MPGLEESPLYERMIFIVGARRSGTNWLQRMLATHSAVVSVPSETHLFSHGIGPLVERFHHGSPSSPRTASVYMDRERMIAALRTFCDEVFGGLANVIDPAAERIVERTPVHVHQLGLITEIYPDAPVLHIIRDGRDVAASLVAQAWGPDTLAAAAGEWVRAISDARSAKPEHYCEVRYEELLADPAGGVERLFGWLKLEVNDELLSAVTREAGTLFNVTRGSTGVREGKWRAQLSAADREAFEQVAGDLIRELGYSTLETPPPTPEQASHLSHLERTSSGVSRRIRRAARTIRGTKRAGPSADFEIRTSQRYMEQVAGLMDNFLQYVALSDLEGLGSLIHSETAVVVAAQNKKETGRGEQGVRYLYSALLADRESRFKLLSADSHADALGSTVIQSHADRDGHVSSRVYVLSVTGENGTASLRRVAFYTFEAENAGGRHGP